MLDSAPLTWFTENPLPILICGAVVLLVLLVLLLKTGRGAILTAMLAVAVVMGLAVLIDRLVVTDREKIANVIYAGAAAAQRNDLEAVIDLISPDAAGVRAEARRWIGQGGHARLDEVNITAMEVTLNRATNPPTGTARFRVFARGQVIDREGTFGGPYTEILTVHFRREGDRWMVTGYEREGRQ
jgi:hypothetical protein